MKKLIVFLGIFTCSQLLSQNLSPEAALLFKNVKTKIPAADKNTIAKAMGFVLSDNASEPFAQDNESKEFAFAALVYPVDMNKDGVEEIFILYGNSFTSGATGSSVALFIKNPAGKYSNQLGFPGTLPDALIAANKTFPDLLIGGPGFEFPVWRWNGSAYVFSKTIKDSQYGKLKKISVEALSKTYQATLQ